MSTKKTIPKRFIGLDVHKHYLIALGVDADLNVILPVQRVEFYRLEAWMKKTLNQQDAVALEMTTNTWQLYDELSAYVLSVTVVHPPHVALITRDRQDCRFYSGALAGQRPADWHLGTARGSM